MPSICGETSLEMRTFSIQSEAGNDPPPPRCAAVCMVPSNAGCGGELSGPAAGLRRAGGSHVLLGQGDRRLQRQQGIVSGLRRSCKSAAPRGRHASWVGPCSALLSPPDPGRWETHAHRAPVPARPSRAAAPWSAARLPTVTQSAALGGRHASWVGPCSALPSPPDPGRWKPHAHRGPVPGRPSRAAAAGLRSILNAT